MALAAKNLIARPFWSRIWVLQEIALNRSVMVFLGNARPSGDLESFLVALSSLSVFAEIFSDLLDQTRLGPVLAISLKPKELRNMLGEVVWLKST